MCIELFYLEGEFMDYRNTTQRTLKAALLLTVLALLSACSAQKKSQGSMDSSSRIIAAPGNTTSSTSSSLLYCNQKSQGGLTAKLMVYTDTANHLRPDYLKLKFTEMPASFESGDYIQFFRWQANTSGQVYLDPVPTQARFETLDGQILTSFSPVIYWGQVADIASRSGMSSVSTFLQYVRLVIDIRDPQGSFDVLKVAMYKRADNSNTLNMDMLMPAFSASPSDYAVEGGAPRASQLQALHPFAGMGDQAWTAAQYQSMATTFCF